jgi:hypothetical protein
LPAACAHPECCTEEYPCHSVSNLFGFFILPPTPINLLTHLA